MAFRTDPGNRPLPLHGRSPAHPHTGCAALAGGITPPALQGARGRPRPSQRLRNFLQGQGRNADRAAQGAGPSRQPGAAAPSVLRQVRPFPLHGKRVVIGSWGGLQALLHQGPPFPTKTFDGMMSFLSREGSAWGKDHKRWKQLGCPGQAPPKPDAGYFTKLAAPESERSDRLLIDTLLDAFWRQAPEEALQFGPMKLSQWAYAMPLWSETGAAPALLRKTRELVGHEAMKPNGQSIGNLAYNLAHVPRQYQDLALDVLDALRARMAAAPAGSIEFNGQNIGNALYGLRNLPDSKAVQGFLSALTAHMTAALTGGIQFNGQNIGNALYGLQNLADSKEVQGFLSALTSHMAAAPAGGIQFNGQNIGNALYGLEQLPDSPQTRAFLAALERHLAKGTLTVEGFIEPHLFLADVLHSLRGHLLAPAAPRILAILYHRLGQPQERLAAALKNTAAECYRLFKAGGGLRLPSAGQRRCKHDLPGIAPGDAYSELDLHGCSHKQMPSLLKSALDRDNGDLSGIVRIIYGVGKHNEHNRGMMRDLVRQTLRDPANDGLQGLMLGMQFHHGHVWVYKSRSASDTVSAIAAMKNPAAQR